MPDVTITVPASATVDGRRASDIHAEQNPKLPPIGSLWERKDGYRVMVRLSLDRPHSYVSLVHDRPLGVDHLYLDAAGFAAWAKRYEAVCVYPAKEGGGA